MLKCCFSISYHKRPSNFNQEKSVPLNVVITEFSPYTTQYEDALSEQSLESIKKQANSSVSTETPLSDSNFNEAKSTKITANSIKLKNNIISKDLSNETFNNNYEQLIIRNPHTQSATSFFTALSHVSSDDSTFPTVCTEPSSSYFQNSSILPRCCFQFQKQIINFQLFKKVKSLVFSRRHGVEITDYYSVNEEFSFVSALESLPDEENYATRSCCSCKELVHSNFVPEIPLVLAQGLVADSYEDRLCVAQSLVGRWITIVERSQSLDEQYKCIGLGKLKRAVMNRLRIPLTMFLEDDDQVLHCWIHTPLGIRHMRSNLRGEECEDHDPDAGRWVGTTRTIDYLIPWFCSSPVRALQQVRTNPNIGTSVETRCVLPDKAEQKLLYFNFVMYPKNTKIKLTADRLLKFSEEDFA